MTDRSRDLVVALLLYLARGIAFMGWPIILTIDLMALSDQDRRPAWAPLHGLFIAGLIVATAIAIIDWRHHRAAKQHAAELGALKDHIDQRMDSLGPPTLDLGGHLHHVRAGSARGVVSRNLVATTYRSAGPAPVTRRRRSRRKRSTNTGDLTQQWDAYQAGLADGFRGTTDDPD